MKKLLFAGIFAIALITISATTIEKNNEDLTKDFVTGDLEIGSINQLSFGPQGILFIGDSKNAAIYALDTKDTEQTISAKGINIADFDDKIASALGTTKENIKITDMAVNPVSKTAYFSVTTTEGTPVLLKLNGETLENVSLKNASYSKVALSNPVSEDFKDKRGRSQRNWAIADLKYHDGNLMVTGLSNQEFSSTFRSIPFPFTGKQDYASLEIWHAAHGKFETYAPIKTFDFITIEDKEYLMASYTCTPLVLFPMEDLKGGKHLKGRTVAELGAGNSPMDMLSYQKDGKTYFLMSNTNRSVMRFDYDAIADFKESYTKPTKVNNYGAMGVPYISLPMVNVLQLDNLDAENVVYLQRTANGSLVLRSRPTKRV
ncbi:hypothetical protein [uncultured Maribacter sp.]|uniref:hypothetical protein n=1 Tax=uncultured Maribacter sp. TaxID=431308 RepID=UPI002617E498|nr:hypothetical protein [uncultured Maribacter sp.]